MVGDGINDASALVWLILVWASDYNLLVISSAAVLL